MVSPLDVVAASATGPAPQYQSPFFQRFPPEVRRIIYDYCAYDSFADDDRELALLKACKRIALEATAPMQKYARVSFVLCLDWPVGLSDEDSIGSWRGFFATDGTTRANTDEESTHEDNADDFMVDSERSSSWCGVHTVGGAHITKAEHVFIDLMAEIDSGFDLINWEDVAEDPELYQIYQSGMPMLNEFAVSHGWDIKSVTVDLGPHFDAQVDRSAKFSFVKGFLESSVIPQKEHVPLFGRLVQQKGINFTGLTFSPFPIIECLNDPAGWEDDGNPGY